MGLNWAEHSVEINAPIDTCFAAIIDYETFPSWQGADVHYLFEDLGDSRTRATYKLGLEVGIPLPGPVARRAHKTTLKGSVEDLKREAERRAASSATTSE